MQRVNPKNVTSRYFRFVCSPGELPAVEDLLRTQGYTWNDLDISPWCKELVDEPSPLGDSLAARFGLIYIQDKSSMLPPLLLDPPQGAMVLDMCASPGSKTGLLAQLVGPEGFVLGNEPSRDRLATLRQNLRRLNLANTATCSYPGEKLPLEPDSLEYILLDPPCSGWGTTDKNPNILEVWNDEKTGQLETLQRRLLERAADALAPGGRMIFSTCTTNVRENEEQVVYALEHLGLELNPLPPVPGLVFETPKLGLEGVLRVDMKASRSQGFFMACFGKAGASDAASIVGGNDSRSIPGRPVDPASTAPLVPPAQLSALPPGSLYDFTGRVMLLHEHSAKLPASLRWQGFPVGKFAGKTFRPDSSIRQLVPAWKEGNGLNLDSVEPLLALLSGQSLEAPAKGTGLYYKGLSLGRFTRKGKRALR